MFINWTPAETFATSAALILSATKFKVKQRVLQLLQRPLSKCKQLHLTSTTPPPKHCLKKRVPFARHYKNIFNIVIKFFLEVKTHTSFSKSLFCTVTDNYLNHSFLQG